MVALGTHRPALGGGRDRFARLLRAEWTKFRTVRGWVIALLIAAVLPTVFALLNNSSCGGSGCVASLTGPGGGAVTDQFSFVHRALAADGSITVRVTSLTGLTQARQRHRQRRGGGKPDRRLDAGPRAVVQGRDHRQVVYHAGIGVRGDDGHRRPRGADAVELHR